MPTSRAAPSPAYTQALAEAAAHHASDKTFSGKFLRPQKPVLLGLIGRLGITSALDYGAGKGAQYEWVDPEDGLTLEQAFGFSVARYDPAWPPYAALPEGRFDLVICTFTLGCIPLVDLAEWVLPELHAKARKAVFVMEALGEPKKKVFSEPGGLPRFSRASEWLELISPHTREEIETHVAIRRRGTEDGTQIERFVL